MVPLSSISAVTVQRPAAATPTRPSFGETLRAQGAPGPAAPRPAPATWTRAALEHVERARERLDEVLAAARRGQTFTPQELLALQSQAYRYSQTIEVASKVVEQAVQSLKQAVQTQV